MPVVLPNQGLPYLLKILLKLTVSGVVTWKLMLWVNEDLEPDQDTVFDSLEEATFGGYSQLDLTRSKWTEPIIANDHSVSTWGEIAQLWTCVSDPQDIYGYAIFDPASSYLLFCEKFAEVQELEVGRTLGLLPRLTLTTEPTE